jgi:hypothetical protein
MESKVTLKRRGDGETENFKKVFAGAFPSLASIGPINWSMLEPPLFQHRCNINVCSSKSEGFNSSKKQRGQCCKHIFVISMKNKTNALSLPNV